MKVDRKAATKNLKKKGFRRDPTGTHVVFVHEYRGKESGIKTYVSHSRKYKDIGPDNLESMKRQLQLSTRQELINLLKCPMTGDEYSNILITQGSFDPENV